MIGKSQTIQGSTVSKLAPQEASEYIFAAILR
jgi:hypothetical protein